MLSMNSPDNPDARQPSLRVLIVDDSLEDALLVPQELAHTQFQLSWERNWMLNTTLSDRSRDNLPNPDQKDHSYVPRNMPAIGDLFDVFDFRK
jgi:phospholipase C